MSALRIASALSLLASGCGEDLPTRISRGAYVLIDRTEAEHDLCAGSLDHLDRFVERTFEFFGRSVPPDFHVEIFVTDDTPCGIPHRPCYAGGKVYVPTLAGAGARPLGSIRHEVAHAVVDHVWGASAGFLNEGFTEALARSISLDDEIIRPRVPIADMVFSAWTAESDYRPAVSFVHYLVREYGLARFQVLYEGAREQDREAREALFLDVYGASLLEVEQRYLADETECVFQIESCDPAASGPVLPVWSFAVACEDPDVYGAAQSGVDTAYATQWTFEVAHSGRYRVRAWFPFRMWRCGPCGMQELQYFSIDTDREIQLAAGLYNLEVDFHSAMYKAAMIELTPLLDASAP